MKKSSIAFTWLLIAALVWLSLQQAGGPAASAQEKPVVRFLLFYGEACPHCHTIMDDYLPTVYEKYGDQVEYQYLETSSSDNYLTLLGLEIKLDVPQESQGAVPALIIGDKVLIGSYDIPDKLEGYIDQYLAQGGVDYPSLDDLPEVVLPTPEPAVQVLVFFDRDHADFGALESFIVSLGQKHGAGLQAYAVDVTIGDNADKLAQLNEAFGADEPAPGTPEVLIDHQLLVGFGEIEQQLPDLIEEYLAQGGINIPPWEELVSGAPSGTATLTPAGPSGTATPTPAVTEPAQKPIHLLYFYETGCPECDRTEYDLNYIQQTYPQVQIVEYNIEQKQALAEWLGERIGVPEEERLQSPALFIGNDHLPPDRMNLGNIQAAVEKYVATGAQPIWEEFDPQQQTKAEQTLIERYKSLGALTVLGAGLVNGLNPCAFVTIVFFLSYLAFVGRQGRQVLLVGATFTLGVFVAYLLAGLGLSRLLESLGSVQLTLKRLMFSFTTLLCLALAGISLHDCLKARQGKIDEMKIKLSLDLRRQVHRVIRQGAQMRAFYAVAFGVGAIVSLIQLTCTSPIYINIVFLIHEVPEMQANAYLYLLLYNLAYIVPLVVIFVLAYFGTSSEQLGNFITQRTAPIKLLTAVVFLVMAGWLIYNLLPLFGVT